LYIAQPPNPFSLDVSYYHGLLYIYIYINIYIYIVVF